MERLLLAAPLTLAIGMTLHWPIIGWAYASRVCYAHAIARIAVVTGAARGIGAALARRMAEDGFAVAAVDLSAEACADVVGQIEEAGGTARAFAADVAREESVAQVMDAVVAELGAPAVLINNAGVLRDNLLFKMSAQDWDTVMDVHLRGHFLMTRAAQRHMTEQGWGRIVNISSTSALGNRGQANYAASKAGVIGLSKSLAAEVASRGITVNCVAPGFIATAMTEALNALGATAVGMPVPEVAQAREAAALIGAGAIDGLSIGYRTIRAERDRQGRRVLAEVELWEVSLVTFPMLPGARFRAKTD